MNSSEDKQFRGWAIDYALRLRKPDESVTAQEVIKDAKIFHQFIEGRNSAKIIKMAKSNAPTSN